MIRRPTTRRPGTSLLEVLVGLGIMAVGAISAFVLFPLSAINVSRAMVDDRATTCAITADGQARDFHRRNVVEREAMGLPASEAYHFAMDNPAVGGVTAMPPLSPNDPNPSYPVFTDPMGIAARGVVPVGTFATRVGTTFVPRVDLAVTTGNKSLALRFCSQLDGLTFDEGGKVPGGFDMRELRYNWLWVFQRPSNRDRYTVRQQIVIHDKRQHLFAPPGSEAGYDNVLFVPGETSISNVPAIAIDAGLRRGSWVMDATVTDGSATDTPEGDGNRRPKRHAEFYRVLSVTENTSTNPSTYVLEVHKEITRPDGLLARTAGANPYAYTGTLVFFPAVVEVFERPVLTGLAGQ